MSKEVESDSQSHSLGVLFTGYVEKQNPVSKKFKKRFLILTKESIYWFNRLEKNNSELFGEERGHVNLISILSVRILDSDSTIFEIQTIHGDKKYFRCQSNSSAEEWVSGIRSTMKTLISIHNDENDNKNDQKIVEINVILVSLRSITSIGTENEIVIARNPIYGRVIILPNMKPLDRLIISLSNGGYINVSASILIDKSELDREFDIPVQSVALASSLKMSMSLINKIDNTNISNSKSLLFCLLSSLRYNKKNMITLILSSMFLLICLSSIYSITSDSWLMYILAISLAIHSIYHIIKESSNIRNMKGNNAGMNYQLVLHGHNFTSPDVPVNQPEDDIPVRFINGCDGDMKEARRRWDITKRWRETEGVNTILEEPQPNYFSIKKFYPYYHAGRGKEGHVVFYERAGELQYDQLTARGIKVENLVRHFLFVTEYQWQIMCEGDELAKSISIIDIGNVKMADAAGDQLEYLKKTASIANQHYPERSYVIYIINAPVWFSFLWRIIRPLVHENTQKKIRILSRSQTLVGLQEHIDISNIPSYYGGQLDFGGPDSCRFFSPDVIALDNFVLNLNSKGQKVETSESKSSDICPPGNPGEVPNILDNISNSSLRMSNGESKMDSYEESHDDSVDSKLDSKVDRKVSFNSVSKVSNQLERKVSDVAIVERKVEVKPVPKVPTLTTPSVSSSSNISISPLTPDSSFITRSNGNNISTLTPSSIRSPIAKPRTPVLNTKVYIH